MELYRQRHYPAPIQAALRTPLSIEIANRWMLGWPKRVKALIEADKYLSALKEQEETERSVLSEPGNGHLAHHEIAEIYGLSPAPPVL
jgi:hypothetical protein